MQRHYNLIEGRMVRQIGSDRVVLAYFDFNWQIGFGAQWGGRRHAVRMHLRHHNEITPEHISRAVRALREARWSREFLVRRWKGRHRYRVFSPARNDWYRTRHCFRPATSRFRPAQPRGRV